MLGTRFRPSCFVRFWGRFFAIIAVFAPFAAAPAGASDTADTAPSAPPQLEFHNRDTGQALPLISLTSKTQITGPVSATDIEFVVENKNEKPIEAAVTFEVPQGTVLTKFGYFYGDRFIVGKMYDKDEAWKIYQAVTSRGRDPGIMDRPTETNYHAQIFPVAPNKNLRVRVTLVQMGQGRNQKLRFELPLVQGAAYLNGYNPKPFHVDAAVSVATNRRDAAITARGPNAQTLAFSVGGKNRTAHYVRTFSPRAGLTVDVPFENETPSGVRYSGYSCMVGPNEGYYVVTASAPRALQNVRARTFGSGTTGMALPTAFGNTEANADLHLVGKYTEAERVRVRFRSKNGDYSVPLYLSSSRVSNVRDTPAGALWADKRIAVLQTSYQRNFKPDIIKLSQRFMVVSNFTALLAIPQEELDYYRNVLAKQKIQTNTQTMGGGGGDPYIAVHAPADCAQVVALFPNGDIKNLTWNAAKKVWDGRFDIPFGTPEGAFRVTVLVVHNSGQRTEFTLVYQNRLTGPQINTANLQTLTAERGQPVSVAVQGQHIARATVLAPWGEQTLLNDAGNGTWQGTVSVPQTQATGTTTLTVVLLDGAHNRTDITLDLDVR